MNATTSSITPPESGLNKELVITVRTLWIAGGILLTVILCMISICLCYCRRVRKSRSKDNTNKMADIQHTLEMPGKISINTRVRAMTWSTRKDSYENDTPISVTVSKSIQPYATPVSVEQTSVNPLSFSTYQSKVKSINNPDINTPLTPIMELPDTSETDAYQRAKKFISIVPEGQNENSYSSPDAIAQEYPNKIMSQKQWQE